MIIKTKEELEYLVKSGKICKEALNAGISAIKEGVSTYYINSLVAKVIKDAGALPSFLNYDAGDGPFPSESCICLNYQLVHGVPNKDVILKVGDIVTVDVGVNYNGYFTDSAYTVEVGSNNENYFLNTGKRALKNAVKQAVVGKKIGDISYEMQKEVEGAGFNVSIDLAGHGVGKKVHEEPQILCYGKRNTGLSLQKGMVLAIEIMYMKGKPYLTLGSDGYSIDTKDKSLSAQFEHTVVVWDKNPIVLV